MAKKTPTTRAIIPAAEAEQYGVGALALVQDARAFKLKTSKDEDKAADALRGIKIFKKSVEDRFDPIIKPAWKSYKAGTAMKKEILAPVEEADKILRGKIVAFRQAKEVQAAKMQLRRLKKAAEAEEAGDEETALFYEEEAEAVVAQVGNSTVQKRWTWEVVSRQKVPREYLELNSAAINLAIRNGERAIPGLKIYQKENLSVR